MARRDIPGLRQPPCKFDGFRVALGKGFAPTALDALLKPSVPCSFEFSHESGLLELAHRAEYLRNHRSGLAVVNEGIRRVGRNEPDADRLQVAEAKLLNHQVPRKSTGVLDDDDPDPVASNASLHRREAGPPLERRAILELQLRPHRVDASRKIRDAARRK
jgi:hypothetical protein